jgi:predicted Fe-Mo cluster-binding NifX family protein
MRIAIPIQNGRLHPHFGGSEQFAIVEVDPQTRNTIRSEIVPAPEHRPGLFPNWLRKQQVQVVIVGGMGRRALASFDHHGIPVRLGVSGTSVEETVAAYLDGRLTDTPVGCEHGGEGRHRHH